MHFLCLQSVIGSIMPFDLGLVGIPTFVWLRDVLTWMRRVASVGGCRAVFTGVFLFAARPLGYLVHARGSWRRHQRWR